MKSITIIGNLGANAVVRTTSEGKQLMSFNVAVNKADGTAIWFNCVGNLREKVLPYLVKGQTVCVIGDLNADLYKNQIDLSVNIDRIELCGSAPANTNSSQPQSQPMTAPTPGQEQPRVEVY